jgi:hypothetical protein
MAENEENGEKEFELAEANHLRALETNVLHASDVVYWLDATSAVTANDMSRVAHSLQVNFTLKPREIKVLNSVGRMALWRHPAEDDPDVAMIDGYATEAQRTRPAMATFLLEGEVRDATGRYNPRVFSETVGSGEGVAVPLYPSLLGTKIPPGGAIQGHIQLFAGGAPAVWALLELEVEVAVDESMIFRAQADSRGDFIMPLLGLPPLPESITEYDAVMRINADTSASAEAAPDLSTFVVMESESVTVASTFQSELDLEIRPGEVARINSFNKDHLAIQPA